MTTHQISSVAFLIDADNISANAVDEAFDVLKKSGAAVPVRRAYGGLEKLGSMKEALRRHAVHAFVNQGKGTTDVALVVDVMDLLHRDGLPATVAIGSSDADFAPLAVRLREAGLRVICFAQKTKAADSLPRAYDEVFFVDEAVITLPAVVESTEISTILMTQPEPTQNLAKLPPVAESVVKTVAAKEAVAAKVAVKKVAAKKTVAQKVVAKKATAQTKQRSANNKSDVTVADILAAVPALKAGQAQPLGDVVKLLHEAKVLAKSASSTKLFKKFQGEFEVSLKSPNQVRYLTTGQE